MRIGASTSYWSDPLRHVADQVASGGRPGALRSIQQKLYYRSMPDTVTLSHTASLARLGYALADETRARILLTLREAPAFPSDLADALGVSRQKLSNHLACLRGCGLVEGVKDGRHTWYRLSDPHITFALSDLMKLALIVDPDCCTGEGCTCA